MMISEEVIRDALAIDDWTRDSYLLYGSYARGDYESSSDVDVLCITTSRKFAPRIDGRVTLHIYDIKDLLATSKVGGLFILHLIKEAKPIHDPCDYLKQLATAFQKPDSYTSNARLTVGPATALLDVSESLFETAPKPFMHAALFLCRTLVYAEHADRGAFSFSMRELAVKDEIARMICSIKDLSISYSDFRLIRDVVRSKVEWRPGLPEAFSIEEVSRRCQGNALFDGLLRRVVQGLGSDPYMMPVEWSRSTSLDLR
jgi:predicted nucleotidyltransferase